MAVGLGSLTIGTPLLTMDNGLIHAGGFLDSSGRAGDLTVQTGRLTLTGGAQLSTRAEGRGLRALTVEATEALAISGRDSLGAPSGLVSGTSGSGEGPDYHQDAAADHGRRSDPG